MKRLVLVGALVGAFAATSIHAQGTMSGTTALGTVNLAKKVMADGKPLAAGTYQVRLTTDAPKPGAGQTPDSEKYVEFVKGGKVMGREVATIVSADEIGKIAKGKKPARGGSSVELLKGGDYYRVWINKGGTNYIINMPPAA
ncbi:MAG TPA: hypothetical protein VH583_13375 [Vicinamibacterales bacterium]|jgi:hypothetical protein